MFEPSLPSVPSMLLMVFGWGQNLNFLFHHVVSNSATLRSGINAFQADSMSSEHYSKVEWVRKFREVAQAWKDMSFEDREAWEKEAEWQQKQRNSLILQPLATKAEFKASGLPQSEMHAFVNGYIDRSVLRHFCSKASFQRLELNYQNLKCAAEISNYGMRLQDLEAGLKREFVQINMSKSEADKLMGQLFNSPPQQESTGVHEEEHVHHQTCFHKFGCCQKVSNANRAVEFTRL